MPRGEKSTGRKAMTKSAKQGKGAAMMDWLLSYMRSKPAAVFADARDAVKKAGHGVLYPISWGRAQLLLGRVKAKKRGTGEAAMATKARAARAAAAAGAPMMKRGPGRPRKDAGAVAMGAVVKRGPGRPPKAAYARAGSGASIAVAEGDIGRLQAFVAALNAGGKAQLRYDGSGWELTAG